MKIILLSTSDVHGYFMPTNFASRDTVTDFGLARAATVMADIKTHANSDDFVIMIENGDFIQGSPLTNYIAKFDRSAATIYDQVAKQTGYDVRVLGNHEFNYGIQYIKDAIPANSNVLNANILAQDDQPFIGKPYTILEHNGVKVGILGLTTDYIPHWEKPGNIEGLKFEDVVATAKRYVPILRQEADVVVVAYHGGFEADLKTGEPDGMQTGENAGYRLLKEVEGIDALVSGHQHRSIAQIVKGTPVTQPGYRGDHVGAITLELDDDLQITKQAAQLISTRGFKIDEGIANLAVPLTAKLEDWLDSPIGHVKGDMLVKNPLSERAHGSAYLAFINKVQMDAVGTDIAGTALFNDDVPGFSPEVTMRDIVTSYVFPNTVAAEKISGADMKAALERNASYFTVVNGELQVSPKFLEPKVEHYNYDYWSGIDYSFDVSKPVGQRLVCLRYHGVDVADDDELVVAINQYRAVSGGDYMMFDASKIVAENPADITDLIADHFATHAEVEAKVPVNLRTSGYSYMKM
ncbi:bifunctional metallophosphatase/5'-nucleotidase [Periweissella fabalis]|uniref:Bifunctional metallophosphatase/5'-nucleotidase n=1 Tax=Periweissella fabalis TaxID=1070421 RepID=A0A7X6N4K5_9LACO|nr:bifunctional metallophosphatase/5'-nucleotidase [Periweissella fabalis]MCM0599525.1 bifunctional metallophosphatase/5'-nucleotidase [Periweissella fabalis]NKZ23830.1 bifunctional metallophosphatase/5'-nucleotidase [Periweissella fabalis]